MTKNALVKRRQKIWAGLSPLLIWTKSKRTAAFSGKPSLISNTHEKRHFTAYFFFFMTRLPTFHVICGEMSFHKSFKCAAIPIQSGGCVALLWSQFSPGIASLPARQSKIVSMWVKLRKKIRMHHLGDSSKKADTLRSGL